MDFQSFFYSGVLYENGTNIYDYHELSQQSNPDVHVYPYVYTPFLAQLISCFSQNNPLSVQFMWSVLNLIMIPLIFYQSFKLIENPIHTELINKFGILIFVIPLLILFFAPFRYIIIIGQIDLIILLLILLSINLTKYGKNNFSGALLLALAIMLKSSIGLFLLYFLFQKKYKFTLYFVISIILLFLISYYFSPWQWHNYFDFLKFSSQAGITGLPNPGDVANNSLLSLMSQIFGVSTFSRISAWFLIIPVFVYIYFQIRKMNYRDEGFLYLLPFAILVVIAPPFTWRQHFIYLVPGVLVIAYYLLNNFEIKNAIPRLIALFILLFLIGFNFSSIIMKHLTIEIIAKHPINAGILLIIFTLLLVRVKTFELKR